MSATNPMSTMGAAGSGAATSPMAAAVGASAANVGLPAVQSGMATKYWIELIAHPPGSARSLWLLVNNAWKRFDNPPAHMSQIVQDAFLGGANVRVWFDGGLVVGLVVSN